MANQLIFSTEQRVIIYDQYFLTQSASQVQRLFETRFPGAKISSRPSVQHSYPIVLTNLDVPHSRPYTSRKISRIGLWPKIESRTSWNAVGHANHYTKEARFQNLILLSHDK